MCYKPEKNNLLNTDCCPKAIKESIGSFENQFWFKKHTTEDELVLYHYTTADGMKGIIDTCAFRNSDVNFLNDPLELIYGKKVVMDVIYSYLRNTNDQSIVKLLSRLKDIVGVQNTYNTYITCFSEFDNLLSQWERYAANGYGYNIGIHFSSDSDSRTRVWYNLEELFVQNYLPCLRKVIYEIDEQYSVVKKYLDAIIEGSKRYIDENNDIDTSWDAITSIEAANILLEFMYTFKSPSYKEEHEWRLIYTIGKEWKSKIRNYRVSNNLIKPYLNMYIYNYINDDYIFPLQSIKAGPMLEIESVKKSLDEYLKHNSICSSHPIKVKNEIKIG